MNGDKEETMKKQAIPWRRAGRFDRIGRFTVAGEPREVFPLLCPVREYDWLPGWRCRMHWSESGVAEKDAVFSTREAPLVRALWTTITYEPVSFIEYLVVAGGIATMRLSIGLEEAGTGRTAVVWAMRFTTLSWLGARIMGRRFSPEGFDAVMRAREREIGAYLLGGRSASPS
jgi:hypothetical protein